MVSRPPGVRATRRILGMPLYEYVAEEDGSRIELLRAMSEADDPVADPQGKGRTYKRVLSSFSAQADTARSAPPASPCGNCSANGMCGLSPH
jgi:hypothetical protein